MIWYEVHLYQYKTKFNSFETNRTLWFDGVIEDEYLNYIEDCKQIVKITDSRFKKSKSQKFLLKTSSLRDFFAYRKTRWKQENLSIIEQILLESLFPAKEAKSSSSLFWRLLKVEPTRMKKFTAWKTRSQFRLNEKLESNCEHRAEHKSRNKRRTSVQHHRWRHKHYLPFEI